MAFVLLLLTSCGLSKNTSEINDVSNYKTLELQTLDDNDEEYDIIIMDSGYDTFLLTQRPMNFYSQQYYENWNRYYVMDWNQKVQMSLYHTPKYQQVFDMYINYESQIDYGLEVNYKLYNYFMFVEKRYGVKFNIPRAISY